MSFKSKKVPELKKIAKLNLIDLGDARTKAEILEIFEQQEFTEEKYEKSLNYPQQDAEKKEEKAIPVKEQTKSQVVMTMRHDRAVLTALGYTFTKEQPYVLVEYKDAEVMRKRISHEIREASPEEVASFYGVEK